MVKEKLEIAMWKLQKTPITVSNTHLCIHVHLIAHVYFGCGIVRLLPKQEDILRKISEPVLLRKLKLSEKFPREILHARKSALGIGLMKPSTILAILASQLFFGYLRMKDDASTMITSIIHNENVHYKYTKNIIEIDSKYKMMQSTWYDEVAHMLKERKLKVINDNHIKVLDAVNMTIMDLALKYVEEKDLSDMIIPPINQMRHHKRMILPCELIGMLGRRKTFYFENLEASSCILWNIQFSEVPTPSIKTKET